MFVYKLSFEAATALLLDFVCRPNDTAQLQLHRTRNCFRNPVKLGPVFVPKRQVKQEVTACFDAQIFHQRFRPLGTDSLEEFDRGGSAQRFRHSGRKLGQHADRVLQQRLDFLKEGCTCRAVYCAVITTQSELHDFAWNDCTVPNNWNV